MKQNQAFLDLLNKVDSSHTITFKDGSTINAKPCSNKTIKGLVKIIFNQDRNTIPAEFEKKLNQALDECYGEEINDLSYNQRINLIIAMRCLSVGFNYVDRDSKKEYDLEPLFNKITNGEVDTYDESVEHTDSLALPNALFVVDVSVPTIGEAAQTAEKYRRDVISKISKSEDMIMKYQNCELTKFIDTLTIEVGKEKSTINFKDLNAKEADSILDQLHPRVVDKINAKVRDITRVSNDVLDQDDFKIAIDPAFFNEG